MSEEHLSPKAIEKEELDFSTRSHHLVSCPNCKTFISAKDINIEKTIAKCQNCDHVFSFANDFYSPDQITKHGRPEMLIPDGLEVLALRSELDISVNWFKSISKGGFGFIFFFTALWNLLLLPFVSTIVASGNYEILLFISMHLIVGISFIYYLISVLLNKTTINVTSRALKIRTSPLRSPFRRNETIPSADIKQIYVSKYVASRTNNQPNYAYALYAILPHGKKKRLIKGMNKETQQYLEHAIERFLNIKDVKVPDEIEK